MVCAEAGRVAVAARTRQMAKIRERLLEAVGIRVSLSNFLGARKRAAK